MHAEEPARLIGSAVRHSRYRLRPSQGCNYHRCDRAEGRLHGTVVPVEEEQEELEDADADGDYDEENEEPEDDMDIDAEGEDDDDVVMGEA